MVVSTARVSKPESLAGQLTIDFAGVGSIAGPIEVIDGHAVDPFAKRAVLCDCPEWVLVCMIVMIIIIVSYLLDLPMNLIMILIMILFIECYSSFSLHTLNQKVGTRKESGIQIIAYYKNC